MTIAIAQKDTLANVIALIEGGDSINRNTFANCKLPPKNELVEKLRALGVASQVTNDTVTESDWRDVDFTLEGPLTSMFILLRHRENDELATIFAVFDYDTNEFSYC